MDRERCSISLTIEEIQIKIWHKIYHLLAKIKNIDDNHYKQYGELGIIDGNGNWCDLFGGQFGHF